MRRAVLLLDGSEAMASSADYAPSRLYAMRGPVHSFVHGFLESNPLSLLGVVVMRDGVARKLCGLTNSCQRVLEVLEQRYFLYPPQGNLSLDNGLRACLSELAEPLHRGDEDGRMELSHHPSVLAGSYNSRIVLLFGSVTVVDAGDVFSPIELLKKKRIVVDVISLSGGAHIAEKVAEDTGGQLMCPLHLDHLSQQMHELATKNLANRGGGGEEEEGRATRVKVGFPSVHDTLQCPRCHATMGSVPGVCLVCDIIVGTVPALHVSFVSSNKFVPSTEQLAAGGSIVRCSLCTCETTADEAVKCVRCAAVRCGVCEAFVQSKIRLCPTCLPI